MRKIILSLAFLIIFTAQALAKESPENILILLPSKIKSFLAETPKTYPDKRLGASLGYNAPDHTAITIYLYDQGIQDIKDGIDSEIIHTSKEMAMKDIMVYKQIGHWRNVNKIIDREVEFNVGKEKKLKVFYVSYSCDAIADYSGNYVPVISDLYVTGIMSYICKIRVTRSVDTSEITIQEVITTVLSDISNI